MIALPRLLRKGASLDPDLIAGAVVESDRDWRLGFDNRTLPGNDR
jgi:hypothetical protein